jgi:hypothetical protein
MTIFGDHLEDYGAKKYTVVNENPVLMQVDTTTNVDTNSVVSYEIDTLLIKSKFMEGFRDTANFFKAFDSVKIIRGDFASVNDFTLYLRDDKKIITEKTSDSTSRPVLWYENSQLTGDSITIFLQENEIKNLVVNENAFMLSQNKTYTLRFDQTSSKNIRLTFEGNDLQRAEFEEKVQSIYYLFEDEKPNGVSKSTGQNAAIIFADNEVSEVRLYGSPTSEYYPEVKVVGLERTFTLPKFVFNENRPLKKEFLSIINKENGYNTP